MIQSFPKEQKKVFSNFTKIIFITCKIFLAAAKKVVTVMTEDDFDKPKKSQKSKEEPSEIKEKTGGGGRGAREHKTKGKGKKMSQNFIYLIFFYVKFLLR